MEQLSRPQLPAEAPEIAFPESQGFGEKFPKATNSRRMGGTVSGCFAPGGACFSGEDGSGPELVRSAFAGDMGRHYAFLGFLPRAPLLLLPPLGSTPLEVVHHRLRPHWKGQTVWPPSELILKDLHDPSAVAAVDGWIDTMALLMGHGDPEGVTVRPAANAPGSGGIEALAQTLRDVGYDERVMAVMQYDWRLTVTHPSTNYRLIAHTSACSSVRTRC